MGPSREEVIADGMLRLTIEKVQIVEYGDKHDVSEAGTNQSTQGVTVDTADKTADQTSNDTSSGTTDNSANGTNATAGNTNSEATIVGSLDHKVHESNMNESELSAGVEECSRYLVQEQSQDRTSQNTTTESNNTVDIKKFRKRHESAAEKLKYGLRYETIIRKARHMDEQIKKDQHSYTIATHQCHELRKVLAPEIIDITQLKLARDYLVAAEVIREYIAKKVEMKKVHLKLLEEGRKMEMQYEWLGQECRCVYNREMMRARNVSMR